MSAISRQAGSGLPSTGFVPPRGHHRPKRAPVSTADGPFAGRPGADQRAAGAIASSTSSPTLAFADASAALVTPTANPPPATSIVLPPNGAPLSVPSTRYWRRPPNAGTSSAGMSTTARPPAFDSSQR